MPQHFLKYPNPKHLEQLYSQNDQNLLKAEKALNVELTPQGESLSIEGAQDAIKKAEEVFNLLDFGRSQGLKIHDADFANVLNAVIKGQSAAIREIFESPVTINVKKGSIVPKTINQKRYIQFIYKHDIVFGIGPAGTGKTYLAVAVALQALLENKVDRIILTRPAVEAGEALGFLPGDLQEKILPYLRPLYDAMYDMLGKDDTARLLEKNIIEIAPLAYMRGRTLSNVYIILDEAQNTTNEQMMMFLTRLGENSRMIITGDITQVDLPKTKLSGLKQAVEILSKVKGVKLFYFESSDVVRHPLVQRIIEAYEHHANSDKLATAEK